MVAQLPGTDIWQTPVLSLMVCQVSGRAGGAERLSAEKVRATADAANNNTTRPVPDFRLPMFTERRFKTDFGVIASPQRWVSLIIV
jgi:hypothetical protein